MHRALLQVTARLLGYMAGSATVNMIYLADSLGLFAYLAERPNPESSSEVAANMGLAFKERWVRELLHQLVRFASPDRASRSVASFGSTDAAAHGT